MASTNSSIMTVDSTANDDHLLLTPLLMAEHDTVPGAVNFKHTPAVRSNTGRWRSAAFIIGVEMAERIAHFGVSGNLINFMTEILGQSTATAAANVNAWNGVSLILPVLGAIVADSFLGKYYTIIASSIIYILGLGLLTMSAMLPSLNCEISTKDILGCSHDIQTITFFFALYLVAIAQGGHKPCVQAFGADQFDGEDPVESKARSSFFNWWYVGVWTGGLLGLGILSYVQENLGWGLGFGIPCILVAIALLVFVFGTLTYRFIEKWEGQSPFLKIGRVFVAAARNWNARHFDLADSNKTQRILTNHGSEQFRFLDKALLRPELSDLEEASCSTSEVEEAKAILGLLPIWATGLAFAIVFSQTSTFFTKQGVTLDRHIGSSFVIPAASLQCILGICVIIFMPFYDCVLVPIARTFTGKPSGITMLQRVGTGFFLSIICMIVSAIIETKRLEIALKHGLVDLPNATVPMSICWLLPQYALFGIAEAFTMVGLQELFYGQVPNGLRSVGLSMYLTIFGTGNLLSSLLVTLIDKVTSEGGAETSWFSDNLNRGHIDYFYWLLAGLNTIGLILFMYCARSYIYVKIKVST
ncbi:protein NRT1/ PTR FAMILY 5.10-like [Silene latifolia]|uniref:protein NRT1/ PTR FAMILY 5.10-like n=1 Tax=Silene latifolia TaxID=37657 RepID=UPI003D76CE44